MEGLADEELIERYRRETGNLAGRAILNELFGRHHTQVAAWCFRMTGDTETGADLAQEVFLKAFQRLDSYRGTSKFTTWLYSIARNHCLDELRSRATRPRETTDAVLDTIADSASEEISDILERRESEDAVRQLIKDSLDETEATVMTLHYVHDLPLDAITRLMGFTNQSGSKAYIVSAKRKLSRALVKREGR
jgi:RNA polymerase sigma-70 factor, ECF subfamily